ncbi:hypothetical protein RFI_23413 [Reticulomyxa filosa]|uniref:Cilia- and flagella-associated protein 58 central coiled coil domain-containing protein n=1 Tax=Reticulomyxa filosa TaxID=46433 RepID=X6MLL5_RETFI|nr:hypothetical protein RFI_23413 [Reticulomyxa filosa]|eukprot:ETO13955.1 hypothetical protein RFI_23413 [Reticulomyxa filosa]
MDVDSSHGFEILQILENAGEISPDIIKDLRCKFEKLHELIVQSVDNEKSLTEKWHELTDKVKQNEDEVQNCSEQLNTDEQKLESMKTELEKAVQDSQQLEQSIDIKKKENEKFLAPEIEKYKQEITQLDSDVESASEAVLKEKNKENKIYQKYQERLSKCENELLELEQVKLRQRQKLTKYKNSPERLEIQCQMSTHTLQGLTENIQEMESNIRDTSTKIEETRKKRNEKNDIRHDLSRKLSKLRNAIDVKEKEMDDLKKRVEHKWSTCEKKKWIEDAEETRLQLTIEWNEKKNAAKHEAEITSKLNRIFEDSRKKYELLKSKKESIRTLLLPLKEECERSVKKLKDLRLQRKLCVEQMQTQQQDIEVFMTQYLAQEKDETEHKNKLLSLQQVCKDREKTIAGNQTTEKQLKNKLRKLNLEKQKCVAQQSKLKAECHAMQSRIKLKEILSMDLTKKLNVLSIELKMTRKSYEVIRSSRNRYANLVQNTNEALNEMKEKITIVTNELETMKNKAASKELELTDERKLLQQTQHSRDQLRYELNQCTTNFNKVQCEIKRYEMDISKLEVAINCNNHEMETMQRSYANSVKDRNATGVQLIDRNDELCILFEKQHVMEISLQTSTEIIQTKQNEYKRLKLELSDSKRSLEILRQKMPCDEIQRQFTKRLSDLKFQLNGKFGVCKKKKKKNLINIIDKSKQTNQKKMSQKLPGTDSNIGQLESQITMLTVHLACGEEKLLEKELILAEVSQLTEKLQAHACSGQDVILALAQKMNELQCQVNRYNRKIMAGVSELAMYQATALKLETEKENLTHKLMQGKQLLLEGSPPFPEALMEWDKKERDRIIREELLNNPSHEWDESKLLETTCEPRPTDYIASDIAIPKPYGGHPPFKPTPLGANIRHIRKPVTRQIII